jgi:hypothetical protein
MQIIAILQIAAAVTWLASCLLAVGREQTPPRTSGF